MSDLSKEADFFNDIASKVRELVLSFEGKAAVTVQKRIGDYATEVDIAVENIIVEEIKKRFPGDAILAEEGYSDTAIPEGRIWIIDPICGTTNLGRGIKNFCTNIALVDEEKPIAACVVDHSQDDYFWSVGDKKVYINDDLFKPVEYPEDFGIVVDVDFGALGGLDEKTIIKQNDCTRRILLETDYMLVSLSTSLSFAYSAVGKLDGFISVYNHPWDVCSAIFLIEQASGVTSDLDGKPWNIGSSIGLIGARNATIHKQLLDSYLGLGE